MVVPLATQTILDRVVVVSIEDIVTITAGAIGNPVGYISCQSWNDLVAGRCAFVG